MNKGDKVYIVPDNFCLCPEPIECEVLTDINETKEVSVPVIDNFHNRKIIVRLDRVFYSRVKAEEAVDLLYKLRHLRNTDRVLHFLKGDKNEIDITDSHEEGFDEPKNGLYAEGI